MSMLARQRKETVGQYHDRMRGLIDGGKAAEVMNGLLSSPDERVKARAMEMWFRIMGMFEEKEPVVVNVFKANFAGFLKGRPAVDADVRVVKELPEGEES